MPIAAHPARSIARGAPMTDPTRFTPDDYQRLGAIIRQVQSRFILAAPPFEVFDPLLTDLLQFTGSEYGFIANLCVDPADGHRFLRMWVLTDISWNDATRAMVRAHRDGSQPLEFHNLKTLFGAAVTSGLPVIANEPQSDARSGHGLPGGHPAMRAFLGVPLHHGGDMVGVVGLSNRAGGYDQGLIEFLEPLFASVAAIIGAVRIDAARREAEREVRENRAALIAAAAAERANAAKTDFLSRMSHELRTPLNAVLGFAQLLRMDRVHPLTTMQTEQVRHIESAGGHLLAMINDVLDLSRIESGTMPVSLDTVSLGSVIDEARALVAATAAEAGVQVRGEPPAAPVYVRADHLRLRQVIVNLLTNAVKYNRRDGTVTLRWSGDARTGEARLEVRDTGLGMSQEQMAHLFEPFNRLGAESTRVEGTGIGLVISQRLVQLMNGSLSASSEVGAGSCFVLTLQHAEPGAVRLAAADAAAETSEALASGATRTVLYADDNALNVDLVLSILKTRPHLRVLVARSGQEAIDLARAERPHLLLLDMHLGDMTGSQVLRQLALDAATAALPCIAVSADAMPGAISSAEQAGFSAYLTKPLDVRKFLQAIDAALDEG
jgi:signal transduction histidine kinase/ActR/RegA family two-component response regulator